MNTTLQNVKLKSTFLSMKCHRLYNLAPLYFCNCISCNASTTYLVPASSCGGQAGQIIGQQATSYLRAQPFVSPSSEAQLKNLTSASHPDGAPVGPLRLNVHTLPS